jgi:hypothetical protein
VVGTAGSTCTPPAPIVKQTCKQYQTIDLVEELGQFSQNELAPAVDLDHHLTASRKM